MITLTNVMLPLTRRAGRVIDFCKETAEHFQQEYWSAYLLVALVHEVGGVAEQVLKQLGLDENRVLANLQQLTEKQDPEELRLEEARSKDEPLFELATWEANRLGDFYIGTQHLLLALTKLQTSSAELLLGNYGISLVEIRRLTYQILESSKLGSIAKQLQRHSIFICCTIGDIEFGDWLTEQLIDHKLLPFQYGLMSTRNAGNGWENDLSHYLVNVPVMLLALSPASVAAKHVAKERLFFADILERPIIPVLWQDCEIDPALEKLGIIDLRGQREEGIAELVAAIRKHLPTIGRIE